MWNRVRPISGRAVLVAVIVAQSVAIVALLGVLHAYRNAGWVSESEVLNRLSAVEAQYVIQDRQSKTAINLVITAINQHTHLQSDLDTHTHKGTNE